MKKAASIFRSLLAELIIVVSFMLLMTNFVGKTITGDGIGYYDYLPSIFIHNDISRTNFSEQDRIEFEKRVCDYRCYVDYDRFMVNRYPCGTAILQSPFFITTWLLTSLDGDRMDGFQKPFHRSVYYAAIFYLFLALYFLKKLLLLYGRKRSTIILLQVFMVFSTSVTQYATSNAGFSHVYSLFAITAFLYFAKNFFKYKNLNSYLFACLFFGLIVILRQVNVLVILFIPFIAGSYVNLKGGMIHLINKLHVFVIGLAICGLVIFIQLFLWHLQTGQFFVYSYRGYGFNFLDPKIVNILFSYRKGLFIYTPVLLFSLVGLFRMFLKKEYFLFLSWFISFLILTYFFSSWFSWYYGNSYGLRAYVDFYSVFFVLIGFLFDQISGKLKLSMLLIACLTIPLNLIQTYQYKSYILHSVDMNKEMYWKVFLKTHDRYKGIFYKKRIESDEYVIVKEVKLNDVFLPSNSHRKIFESIGADSLKLDETNIIQLSFDNDFRESEVSRVLLSIDEVNQKGNILWHRPYLILFADDDFGKPQRGCFNYEIPIVKDPENKKVTFIVIAGSEGVNLKNIKIKFLSQL